MTRGTAFLCNMAVTTTFLAHRFITPVFGNVLTLVGNTILEFLVASAVFLTLLGIFLMMVLLTPDFGMCQGGVLRRRKGSALYDRWIWRGDRVPLSKILLTEGKGVDQIFWLRFGKSYLIFRIVFGP